MHKALRSSEMSSTRLRRPSISALLLLLLLLNFTALADMGSAASYSPSDLPTAFNGSDQAQFWKIWYDCRWPVGRTYWRRIISTVDIAFNSVPLAGAFKQGQGIQRRIVDHARETHNIVYPETTVGAISKSTVDLINKECKQIVMSTKGKCKSVKKFAMTTLDQIQSYLQVHNYHSSGGDTQKRWQFILQSKAMALLTGASNFKFLIPAGAGLTGWIVSRMRMRRFAFPDLLKTGNKAQMGSVQCDCALLAAQIQQLSEEIKRLAQSKPTTAVNGDSFFSRIYTSYLVAAAIIVYHCYMRLRGFSFSDIMYVTRRDMGNAVVSVTKQLDNVFKTSATTKRDLCKKLKDVENKVDEQTEISERAANIVDVVKSKSSETGHETQAILQELGEKTRKVAHLEAKQEKAASLLFDHLIPAMAGYSNDDMETSTEPANEVVWTNENRSPEGLQLLL